MPELGIYSGDLSLVPVSVIDGSQPADASRRLEWVGRALDELMDMPDTVRRSMGFALRFAQGGAKSDRAKPLKGFGGAGVLEVIEDYDGDTYRAVYTVKFAGVVYVLHCFQKKSKSGIATPRQTMDLIKARLRAAKSDHNSRREK